jgi:glyoxylase-like metal-dependent hydrolase (beta-lactamase superfamily II)
MTAVPDYEIFAVRYATRDGRRSEHFIGGDPHDGPMPMDYFVWAARSAERTFVIDTGFTEETALARKRTFLRCPAEGLSLVGIDAREATDVIVTHMHYDHAGNCHKFPRATFHLQDRARPSGSTWLPRAPDATGLRRIGRAERSSDPATMTEAATSPSRPRPLAAPDAGAHADFPLDGSGARR